MNNSKTILKFVIAFIIAMIAILAFNIKSVYAVDDKSEQAKKMLDLVPDKIDLNINESQYEDSSSIVETKIKEIWKNNNISIENIKLEVWGSRLSLNSDKDYFYLAGVRLNDDTSMQKSISITYTNTNRKNKTDEEYVKKLDIKNLDYLDVKLSDNNNLTAKIDNYYKNINTDSTIKIKSQTSSGGQEGINFWAEYTLIGIFKNDILYDIRKIENISTIPVLTIPNNISEEQLNQYVINYVSNYFRDYAKHITNVSKGINSFSNGINIEKLANIEDIYTINVDNIKNIPQSLIILKKEKSKTEIVSNTDTKTNIKLDTTTDVVPSGTTLVAKKVSNGKAYNTAVTALGKDVSKFEMYDINLISNNTKIQPNGKVKVSIPVPSGYDTSKIVVYRVADDGTKTKYDITITDGFIVFETDHFSNYIVAEQSASTENTKQDDNTNNTKSESTKTDRKLDDTPKTGEETNVTSVVASIISIISTIGLAVIKKF